MERSQDSLFDFTHPVFPSLHKPPLAPPYCCADVQCPDKASGFPACACISGYTGQLSWNGVAWTGTCVGMYSTLSGYCFLPPLFLSLPRF